MKEEREIVKDFLKCLLTEREMRESGVALARANSAIVELENKKKKFNDQIKAEASGVEADISKLSMILQNGYEYRDVECEVDRDFEMKKDLISFVRGRTIGIQNCHISIFSVENAPPSLVMILDVFAKVALYKALGRVIFRDLCRSSSAPALA